MEIDEFQNYAKALGALNEALKCLGKAKPKNQTTHEAKMNFLKERINLVQRFTDARRYKFFFPGMNLLMKATQAF